MEKHGDAQSKIFTKAERLHSRKRIKELFTKGSSFFLYPFKVFVLRVEPGHADIAATQALFSVSKKNFKRAIDRNRLKRQMRELFRLHKAEISLFQDAEKQVLVAILYIGKQHHAYPYLKAKFLELFQRFNTNAPQVSERKREADS